MSANICTCDIYIALDEAHVIFIFLSLFDGTFDQCCNLLSRDAFLGQGAGIDMHGRSLSKLFEILLPVIAKFLDWSRETCPARTWCRSWATPVSSRGPLEDGVRKRTMRKIQEYLSKYVLFPCFCPCWMDLVCLNEALASASYSIADGVAASMQRRTVPVRISSGRLHRVGRAKQSFGQYEFLWYY